MNLPIAKGDGKYTVRAGPDLKKKKKKVAQRIPHNSLLISLGLKFVLSTWSRKRKERQSGL